LVRIVAMARDPVPASVRPNFHIDDSDRLIGGTPKLRFARDRAIFGGLGLQPHKQGGP
jgi:hypothetical protein